jgi:two-component system, OmpR family, response regulator
MYQLTPSPFPMRLLVVEDEPDLLSGLLRALRKEGYVVDGAAEGEDGLYRAQSVDYDAIVLDVMLPKLDGWEILTRLRQTKATPVLMLTARDAPKDRVRGLDGGADVYVVKPFDVAELLARLRALIRRGKRQARAAIELGDVRIDTVGRRVARSGTAVSLTAREYVVLEYLAMRRGEVVTRTELYDHLFGEEDSTLSNIVDVHISNLRKKLGANIIATRRGHGYVIE